MQVCWSQRHLLSLISSSFGFLCGIICLFAENVGDFFLGVDAAFCQQSRYCYCSCLENAFSTELFLAGLLQSKIKSQIYTFLHNSIRIWQTMLFCHCVCVNRTVFCGEFLILNRISFAPPLEEVLVCSIPKMIYSNK